MLHMRFLFALALLVTTACSGGDVKRPPTSQTMLAPERPAGIYSGVGVSARMAADARQMPIYEDGQHLIVGVDQESGGDAVLDAVATRAGGAILYGQLDDGSGDDVLARYLTATTEDPALRWKVAPVVYFGGERGSPDNFERAIRAVQLVNVALPELLKMRIATSGAAVDPSKGVFFDFTDDLKPDAWGTTYNSNSGPGKQITHSEIVIYRNYTDHGDR